MALNKVLRRAKIKRRIRKKVFGTSAIPRLSVFRSNKQIYAQIIDDTTGKTLASAGSLKNDAAQKAAKLEQAAMVGKMIAEKLKVLPPLVTLVTRFTATSLSFNSMSADFTLFKFCCVLILIKI